MDSQGMKASAKHVEISSSGVVGTILLDGVDVSKWVVGYQVEHQSEELPRVIMVLRPDADNALFDGLAHVAIGDETPPGEAIAEWLQNIDPSVLDRAAVDRDLDGSHNELTKAMLEQLADWARGTTGD